MAENRPDYTKFLQKTSMIDDSGNFSKLLYVPLDKNTDFEVDSFKKGFEGLQILQTGDIQAFSNLVLGDNSLLSPRYSGVELLGMQRGTAAVASEGMYEFASTKGKTLAETIEEKNAQALLSFGLQTSLSGQLYRGPSNMTKFNSAIDTINSAAKILNQLKDEEKANAFIEEKLSDKGDFAKAFYMPIAPKLIEEFSAFEESRMIRAIAIDYNLPNFIATNLSQATRAANKQEKEMTAALESEKSDEEKKKSLEEIAKEHNSAASNARAIANQLAGLTYQSLSQEEDKDQN